MRDIKHLNDYQQLLLSALALVHEEDLVAIFRAAGKHRERNHPIILMNAELDKGTSLMDALAEPSALYDLFADDWPDFRVLVKNGNKVHLDFGTNGPPSDLITWVATMAGTGVVEKLEYDGRYYPEGVPTGRDGM